MTEARQTWHYGLVAQWWAEFRDEGPEIAYHQKFIESYGQPALDVACGTGRLLLPYLRAGLDVDGCDISPDMLALCREKAEPCLRFGTDGLQCGGSSRGHGFGAVVGGDESRTGDDPDARR